MSAHKEHALRTDARLKEHFGALALDLLNRPDLIELSVNPDGTMWADFQGSNSMACVGQATESATELFINAVASSTGRSINTGRPSLAAELPTHEPWRGARFQGMLPPLVPGPCYSIRVRAGKVYTLADYETAGIITPSQRAFIESAVDDRKNLLIVGETKAGKTTLLNAILDRIATRAPCERVVLLEDTVELQSRNANLVQMRALDGAYEINDLLKDTLRLRPDFLCVGEVRGKEALTFIKALGTGHPGACTVHASTALSGLRRVEAMIQEASVTPQRMQIAEAIDVIIVIRRDETRPAKRAVTEVMQVKSILSDNDYILENPLA